MRKTSIMLIMGIFISCLLLVGCDIRGGDSSEGYNADIGLPAHEYNVYYSEEITTVLNQLTKRMAGAKQVCDNSITTDIEIKGTEYSISVVEECLNQIKLFNPGEYYSSDSEYAIETLETTISILEEYKENLENNDTEAIKENSKMMQAMFSNLTSSVNPIYK